MKPQEVQGVGLHFKGAVKALGFETYRGVTVIYLTKPKDITFFGTPVDWIMSFFRSVAPEECIYHFYFGNDVQFEKARSYDELILKAHAAIDKVLPPA